MKTENHFCQNIRHHMNHGHIETQYLSEDEKNLYQQIHDLPFLAEAINDPQVSEVMILSPFHIYLHMLRGEKKHSVASIPEDLYSLCWEYLAWKKGIHWNLSHPCASFDTLLHGHKVRVTLTYQALHPDQYEKVFIRKISPSVFSLSDFDVNQESSQLISQLIDEKKNILICGATGSGKTSFLNSLIQLTPDDEHIIINEDLDEIYVERDLYTKLVVNDQINQEKQMQEFCRYSLRMSPDRLVLGEIRSYEVVPFVLSMNTGHKGLMGTIHANNGADAVYRLQLLFQLYSDIPQIQDKTVMGLICQGVDSILYVENKKLKEITHIYGHEQGRVLYETVSV